MLTTAIPRSLLRALVVAAREREKAMPFQTGTVGPINYDQSNSGNPTDTTTAISYTPQQFGAPEGARIIVGTVEIPYEVTRGLAYIEDLVKTEESISFNVFTQAAGGFPIGHHSGEIHVHTTFSWYLQ
jgi:hypothetical protein